MWHGVQHGVFKALLLPQEHPALPAMALLLFSQTATFRWLPVIVMR